MGKCFCQCFVYSPDAIFKEVVIMAWSRSRTPFICACFVACFKLMRSISATSCITWETKMIPLSVILNAGKEACLVMMSIMLFAVFTGVGLETR